MSELGGFDAERNLIRDGNSIAFEGHDFFRVISEDANVFEAQVDQNLRADAAFVLDHTLARGLAIELAALMKMNFRQRAGLLGTIDRKTASRVMEIEKNAAVFFGDSFERRRNEFTAIARRGTKNVASKTVRMDAHERRRIVFQIAANERDVLVMVHVTRIGNHFEFAEARGQSRFRHATHVALVLHAVANQVRHRQHFDAMFLAKFDELRHAGHGAVFVHDFADDPGRIEPGDARKVHGSFGLAGADEHAAVAGAQRENMAGARKILRLGLWVDGREDRDGAVRSADAGGDADARVNRFGESGAVDRSVDGRHEREVELVAAVLGERQANKTAAVLGHEVGSLRRDLFGGHGEVAFVLAVLVVNQDDHAALANLFDSFFHSGERRFGFGHWLSVKRTRTWSLTFSYKWKKRKKQAGAGSHNGRLWQRPVSGARIGMDLRPGLPKLGMCRDRGHDPACLYKRYSIGVNPVFT